MVVGLARVLEAQIQPQAKSIGVHGLGLQAVLADHESQVVDGATPQSGAFERHVCRRVVTQTPNNYDVVGIFRVIAGVGVSDVWCT